ncbi:MAG: tRNA pseudouridine(55) synthase TruB [Candidatus Magasanikbacteria bacterium RIFCSPHIGHO2_02_FULL_45_10]|uniref:tRNA pseudouridine synthase B n=1 Tax=Candidatus Magasanikbacteria bacterium RIFCSPHIGHO2_02_FULL_45_10 TaxID=1798679 RepID=A0A1F6MBH0_9BACT|nr:MAG: tRNA pseudouridine(55) synthase TruB [Candidatus Magasanikbacteria bacterium RIFCSPHIGHO2_02_FULL_45_10]
MNDVFELPENYFLINKPAGWTSFDVIGFIRTNIRKAWPDLKNIKVGHAGTLDPFATGLLIVGLGREATRGLDQFKNLPKTYVATLHLGAVSDTQDSTGIITKMSDVEPPEKTILDVLPKFQGEQRQLPPMFSAKKIAGQRLYKLARQGKEVEREPTTITIYSLKLLSYKYPNLTLEIRCSAGTYIRTVAHDIGQALGTGAYCDRLERTVIGEYYVTDALAPEAALTKILQDFSIRKT